MSVGFLDLHDEPLEMFSIVVGIVQGQGEILSLQFRFIDNRHAAIDPHRVIDSRDEKEQSYMGIVIEVLIRLK